MKSKEDRKYLQPQIWLSGNAQLHTQVHQTPLNIILYACALEINTSVFKGWKWSESHSVMSDSLWPHGLHSPRNSAGQNTGVGSLSFPRKSSQPRNRTRVSCIAGRFFTSWKEKATREALWTQAPSYRNKSFQAHFSLERGVLHFILTFLFLTIIPYTTQFLS